MQHIPELTNCNVDELLEVPNLHVAVYGTLRKGQRAERMLDTASFISTHRMPRTSFCMLSSNGSFPYMLYAPLLDTSGREQVTVRTPTGAFNASTSCFVHASHPTVELYTDVTKDVLQVLDTYEGFPHLYTRHVFYEESYDRNIAIYIWGTVNVNSIVRSSPTYIRRQDWVSHIDGGRSDLHPHRVLFDAIMNGDNLEEVRDEY